MAIFYRSSRVQLRDLKYPNPENYKTIMAAGSIVGHTRKLVVIAAYMPPGDRQHRGRACLDHIGEVISEAKRKYNEPMIILAGDFNQWEIGRVVEDFVDMVEIDAGPTRGSRSIDRIFLNFGQAVTDKGTCPPLETDPLPVSPPSRSDHRVVYVRSKLEKLSYSYLYYNEKSVEDFKD